MANAEITKRVIADAMKQLMTQKPLAKISVGDIVEVCGINRNSFYYHFKDKYDLINWIFYTEITHDLNREEIISAPSWTLIEAVLVFFYENKAFYRNALSVSGQNSFSDYFNELLKMLVKTRTVGMFEGDEDQDFISTFFADAFVVSVFRWLSDGAKMPPERMAALIRKAVTGNATRLIEEGYIVLDAPT